MKLTQRIAVLAGVCALATSVAVSPATAAEPPPEVPPVARLTCRALVVDGAPSAVCEWIVPTGAPSGVELWRGTGDSGELAKVKVFSTSDLTIHRFVDNTVETGKRYGYVLIVLGPEGNPRGRSNLAKVSFVKPPRLELLRLVCEKTDPKMVHCAWNAPTSPTATKLTLFVFVNHGGRLALTTVEPAAAGGFDYAVPDEARLLRFVVASFNAVGGLDGRSPEVALAYPAPGT